MLGWLQPGEVPSNTLAETFRIRALSLMQSYNLDRNKIFTINRTVYTMSAAQKTQSIGPGGQFDGPRPNDLSEANLLLQSAPTYRIPLDILDADQYADITMPDIVSIPRKIYYDAGYKQTAVIGTGLLYFWPVPNAIYQVELFTTEGLQALATLATVLKMPDGYDRMIASNLAIELAPELGRVVTPELAAIALGSMEAITSKNAPSPIMKSELAIGQSRRSRFNYLTGEPT